MTSPENLLENPEAVARELQEFRASALLLFSGAESLIDNHDGRWIAARNGAIVAESATYDGVFERMYELGVDPRYTLVRHIQQNQRTLII